MFHFLCSCNCSFCPLLIQQQKTALMKNNVPLRAKSKNNGTNVRSELHILPHSCPVFFPSSLLSISFAVCSSVNIKILFSLLTCWDIFPLYNTTIFSSQLKECGNVQLQLFTPLTASDNLCSDHAVAALTYPCPRVFPPTTS